MLYLELVLLFLILIQRSFAENAINCLLVVNLSNIEHCFTPLNSAMLFNHEIGMKLRDLIAGNSFCVI